MKLVLALLCAAPALALAAPALPAKIAIATPAQQEARAVAFKKRNPQVWDRVLVDHHGFIRQVITHDRALAAAKPAQIEAFLRANADLFGIDPDDARHVRDGATWDATQVGAVVFGQISVDQPAGELVVYVMFHVEAAPKLTEAELAKRVIGQRYADRIGYARAPQRDCAMTPQGAAGCVTPVEHARTREVTLAARDVRTATAFYADGDTFRLIGCVDASMLASPPPDPSWGDVGAREHVFKPAAGAPPLPYFVDLVTGDVLAIPAAHDCYDPVFADPR